MPFCKIFFNELVTQLINSSCDNSSVLNIGLDSRNFSWKWFNIEVWRSIDICVVLHLFEEKKSSILCMLSLGCRLSADAERNNCEKCTTCFPYGSRRRQCDLFLCMIVFIIFVLLLAQMDNHLWTDEICVSNATCESKMLSTLLHLTPNIQQKLAELQFIHRAQMCVLSSK